MSAPKVPAIGKVVRDAAVFNPRKWEEAAETPDSEGLLEGVDRLFRLLEEREIAYVLVGGIALLAYVEGRNTEDVDLIVARDSLANLPELESVSEDRDFARAALGPLRIDLLLTDNPLFREIAEKHTASRSFAGRTVPCATVEGLLLLKLYALPSLYRQGEFARVGLYENDLATLLQEYRPEIEPLLDALVPHLSATDMAELRGIVAEIRQRIERFEQGSFGGGDEPG